MNELKEYFEKRIAELKEADAEFCRMRWDMGKDQLYRNFYREASNEVTGRRRELEDAQTFFNNLLKPDVIGQSELLQPPCTECDKKGCIKCAGSGYVLDEPLQ